MADLVRSFTIDALFASGKVATELVMPFEKMCPR